MGALEVTDDSFASEVLNSELPVLGDFWAEWCGPCKMVSPIVEELSKEYNGKVKVAKLDVDSNPQTATNYGIRGIPTLLMFKDGSAVDQIVGPVPKTQIAERLDKIIT
ncbi:MAG: thioredoxin [Chloroflexota bacterium]|nr:MAG: thioredoxin [Chloroflexota bacterium]